MPLSTPPFLNELIDRLLLGDGERVRARWFGDQACRDYILANYDEELLGFFDHTHPGYYRGDICRAAVLYREGGFYTDVDVELRVPLTELVDENTTFMSAYSVNGDIFNGLLAAVPNSEGMGETLQEIRRWFRGETEQIGLMGTMTMLRGLENVVSMSCAAKTLEGVKSETQWACGRHQIRLYQEAGLMCPNEGGPRSAPSDECPWERRGAPDMMRLGLFYPNLQRARSLIGWPRYHSCKDPSGGCGSGGHAVLLQRRRLRHRAVSP